MSVQILLGSVMLGICSLIHLLLVVLWVGHLKKYSEAPNMLPIFIRLLFPIVGTFALLVFSHTIQIWIWAIVLVWFGALADLFQALYFSLVTYTTVGYGDVILNDDYKVFGAMASVTGVLNFGVSTAVLIAILGKVFPNHLGE